MHWKDEGYLLSKNNFNENSIIIETFTLDHGKYTGIVYGGSSRKQKKNFQIGNKISLNWNSKGQNKSGYFTIELVRAVSPYYFDDKERSISILSATSILKILLPEAETNKKIYNTLENLINDLPKKNWIKSYLFWELSLIKELGFENNFISDNTFNDTVIINQKSYKVPKMLLDKDIMLSKVDIREALLFNKALLMENFIIPNRLKFPLSRNTLEKYYI